MKDLLKGILGFVFPFFCAYIASAYNNILITIMVFVIAMGISIFIFRANLIMLIGIRIYSDNAQKGAKVLRYAYKTGKLKPARQLIYAYLILRAGMLDEAETVINKALVIGKNVLTEPEVKGSQFNRAIITWKRGDLASAIVEMEDLYEDGYRTSGLYGTLGCFYVINKEYDKAVEIAKEGIEYNSSDAVSKDNLGQAYIGLGMLDEAEKLYSELLKLEPKFIEPYWNYGTVMEKRGNLSQAKKYYEKALEYDEKFLSTITHDDVCDSIKRVEELMI